MTVHIEGGLSSSALYKRALEVMPGGNSRHTIFFPPHPLYAARAAGARVWDVDGVERIDCINNYSSLIHGHNHPEIVAAIREQAGLVTSIAMPTEREIELAEIVCERLPGVERIRFANSGTEGVMFAIKAARAFTGRPKIAKIEGAYHGSDGTAGISVSPDPAQWGDPDAPASVAPAGTGPGTAADTVILPMNRVEAARAILRAHGDTLAGVIVDPMVKNLGYAAATPEYLAMLREETRSLGALLIFDEVYSLRLGFHGAQGATGVIPDLTAMGKIIGGGLPIGAVGGKAGIMDELFDPRGSAKLAHGGTFNANPLTMAAGVAAMRLFDEAAFDRLSILGDRLRSGLREALKIAGSPGMVGGATSMISLFHLEAEIVTYRDIAAAMAANPDALRRGDLFFRGMLDRGYIMAPHGFFVLSTPMTEADIDRLIDDALATLRTLDGAPK